MTSRASKWLAGRTETQICLVLKLMGQTVPVDAAWGERLSGIG